MEPHFRESIWGGDSSNRPKMTRSQPGDLGEEQSGGGDDGKRKGSGGRYKHPFSCKISTVLQSSVLQEGKLTRREEKAHVQGHRAESPTRAPGGVQGAL